MKDASSHEINSLAASSSVVGEPESDGEVTASTQTSLDGAQAVGNKSLFYLFCFALLSTVGGLSAICIKQILLPLQVSILDPVNTNTSFAMIASLGAVAGLIASPLSGALSDRTTFLLGHRRTWIIVGGISALLGWVMMASAPNIALLLLGQIISQAGVDAILTLSTALIPEQFPARMRALAGAINGMAPIVGGVLGLNLVARLGQADTGNFWLGYALLGGVSLICIVLFLLVLREKPLQKETIPPFHPTRFLRSFVQPLRGPDFTYVLVSRFFAFLAYTLVGTFFLFFLRDGLRLPVAQATQTVATFQVVLTGSLLVTALLSGYLAKRFDRLKPLISGGTILMMIGVSLLALFPSSSSILLAACLFGGGFGIYIAVDIPLALRVLPRAEESGKDIGLMHTAIFLALIVSPIIGAAVLNLFGNNFVPLFATASVSCLLALILIQPVKSVR